MKPIHDLICYHCKQIIEDQTVLTYQVGKDSRNLTRRTFHFDPCWLQVPDLAKQGIYELVWDIPTLIDRKELT